MKMYEISAAINAIINSADDDGVLSDEAFAALESLEMQKSEKACSIAKVIKTIEAEADAMRDAEKRIAERRKTKENEAERLKNYLSLYADGEKYSDPEISIGWRKSEQLIVDDGAQVPDEYIKTVVSVDKVALKQAVKSGLSLDGVRIAQKNNIAIK